MPAAVVGRYCAVVERFDLLVSTRTIAARETQAVFNQRAKSLHTWLGALNLGLVEGRQRERESGAACGCGLSSDWRRASHRRWEGQLSASSGPLPGPDERPLETDLKAQPTRPARCVA
jgi:hypothetical protein